MAYKNFHFNGNFFTHLCNRLHIIISVCGVKYDITEIALPWCGLVLCEQAQAIKQKRWLWVWVWVWSGFHYSFTVKGRAS